MIVRQVDSRDVPVLLDGVSAYNSNRRYVRANFDKYFPATDDVVCYGAFENGRLAALAVVTLATVRSGFVFLHTIQSFAKGAGRTLLEYLLNRFSCIAWCTDWTLSDGDYDKIASYYRSFGVEELNVYSDVSLPFRRYIRFFYKTEDAASAARIVRYFNDTYGSCGLQDGAYAV